MERESYPNTDGGEREEGRGERYGKKSDRRKLRETWKRE